MKRCPQCGQQFSDDYSFCLDDGTVLSVESAPYRDVPTQVVPRQVIAGPQGVKSSPPWIYVLVGCLVTALAGTVYLLAFRGDTARPSNPGAVYADNGVPTTSQPSITPSDQPRRETSATNTPPQSVAPEQTKNELEGSIRSWISAGESRDIDSTMRFYADVVDYYRKPGSTKSFVRSDKQRYYNKFQTASVTISDLVITPSVDGSSAEALFDKNWTYDGNSNFSGKVRQQLKFRKFGGKWLITGERDLKVYYVNK